MKQKLLSKKDGLFLNAKQKAINYLVKYFKDSKDSWANDKIDKVVNLKSWPASNNDLHRVNASAKGIILKAHLQHLYPNSKFSIVKPHYGSLNVSWIGGDYPWGIGKIKDLYVHAGNSDMQSDYYDYDLHLLLINSKSGDQHFYDSPDEALHDLDDFIKKKKYDGVSYYDKMIAYLADLVGVKA